jgi:hypothetical protein
MGHIHAELMAQYAEDAKQHEKPWQLWQNYVSGTWENCENHPSWHSDSQYRRKPRTIKIGDIEVSEPCREAPEVGQKVWAIHPVNHVEPFTWYSSKACYDALEGGFVHLTEEAAQQHYEAIKSMLGGK